MGSASELTEDQRKIVEKFINKCRYAVIGTVGNGTKVRLAVLTNLKEQTLDDIYFVSKVDTEKVTHLKENPECEILYARKRGQVMIHGRAVVIEDTEIDYDNFYMAGIEEYFPLEIGKDNLCFIRVYPEEIRAMIL